MTKKKEKDMNSKGPSDYQPNKSSFEKSDTSGAQRVPLNAIELEAMWTDEGIINLAEIIEFIKKTDLSGWDNEELQHLKDILNEKTNNKSPNFRDEGQKFIKELLEGIKQYYFPGPLDIANSLKLSNTYKTLPEPNNQGKNEPIYQYSEGRYIRAEESIKTEAHREYIRQWGRMRTYCQDEISIQGKNVNPKIPTLKDRLEAAVHRGPSTYEISEVAEIIRRTTFVNAELLNPHTHIPFRNGLLNLESIKLEPFDPEKFFTYRVEADYLERFVSLKDAPLFEGYFRSVFHPLDIPQVLQYLGYSLMPGKPRDKVLFIVGREGIGKGVLDRLMEGLLGEGKGAIDLNKLLTADRFQFSGLDGKVLLTDPEIDRKFRRDAKVSPRNFNTLFGSDAAYTEKKFQEGKKRVYHSKALFLGNLPLFKLDDMAAFRRILLVQTLTDRTSRDDVYFHLKILEKERDVIATLLVQYLRVLKACDWVFINEPTKESIADLWALFADPIAGFEDEYLSEEQGNEVKVDDLYQYFEVIYCKPKGITAPRKQTFTSRIARNYPKVRGGPKGKRFYKFQNLLCEGLDQDGSSKLDTTKNDGGNLKITVSRDNRYGVQLKYNLLSKGGSYTPLSREYVPKMDTDKNISPEPENKAPEKNKNGVQLGRHKKWYMVIKSFNPDNDPLKRNLSSGEGTILEFDPEDEYGKLLRNEGYIVPFKGDDPK